MGEVYLPAEDIAARVHELGAEIAADYADREPLLVAALKASLFFVTDLSRSIHILHHLDFIELQGYDGAATGGHSEIRLLKDLDTDVTGRDLIIVEDVVDTGLTLHFLARTLALRNPASLSAVTLFDRPYRRLVDDLPLPYIGFTVPDELLAGYGLGLEERWRALPNVHFVTTDALPSAAADAA